MPLLRVNLRSAKALTPNLGTVTSYPGVYPFCNSHAELGLKASVPHGATSPLCLITLLDVKIKYPPHTVYTNTWHRQGSLEGKMHDFWWFKNVIMSVCNISHSLKMYSF